MRSICFYFLFFVSVIPLWSEDLYGDGTRWIITGCLWNEDSYKKYAEFEINGDTIVDSVAYKKAYMTNSDGKSTLVALLRETADSVIYARACDLENYNRGLSDEWLLYDFSKWNKGIFTVSPYGYNFGEIDVHSIKLTSENLSEVMLVDGSVTSACYWEAEDLTFIRGIGNIEYWGPFVWMNLMGMTDVIPVPYFYRFYRNGRLLYENPLYAPTGIVSISENEISFSQVDDVCSFSITGDVSSWNLTLYNSNGVTVYKDSGNGSEIVLPVTSVGLHVLMINVNGKQYTEKIFIK